MPSDTNDNINDAQQVSASVVSSLKKRFQLICCAIGLAVVLPVSAYSEPSNIGLMSGGVNGTYVRVAQNMSDALDSDQLRIITMLGKGSRQNIRDLIELDSVDLAIVQSDVLREIARTNEIPGATGSIRYITKLYDEEIHIIAKKSVPSLKSLEGEFVGVGREGSGTEMTASLLFEALGMQVQPVNTAGGKEAIAALNDGLISAAVFVVGKPSGFLQGLAPNNEYKFLDLKIPENIELPYFDTTLTSEDYPNLIRKRADVSTVSVGAVLAVFNWREGSRRYELLETFTNQLFTSIDQLKSEPYHPKWRSVDLKIQIPEWKRFKPATEWIKNN